jgi:hypothetical protein
MLATVFAPGFIVNALAPRIKPGMFSCRRDHEGDEMKKLITIIFFASLAAGSLSGCATDGHGLGANTPNFMGEHPEVDEDEKLVNEEFKKEH